MLVNPSSSAVLSALRFSGRFMVTVAMPSLIVQRISSAMICLLVGVLHVHISFFSNAGQGEGKADVKNPAIARQDCSICSQFMLSYRENMQRDLNSQLKRQRTWVFLVTVVTFTVVLAIARLLSPVPPQPLGFVVCFRLAGVVI